MMSRRSGPGPEISYPAWKETCASSSTPPLSRDGYDPVAGTLRRGKPANLRGVADELLAFARTRKFYYQIRLVNAGQDELLRIQCDDVIDSASRCAIVPDALLSHGRGAWYALFAGSLAPGQIAFHPVELLYRGTAPHSGHQLRCSAVGPCGPQGDTYRECLCGEPLPRTGDKAHQRHRPVRHTRRGGRPLYVRFARAERLEPAHRPAGGRQPAEGLRPVDRRADPLRPRGGHCRGG